MPYDMALDTVAADDTSARLIYRLSQDPGLFALVARAVAPFSVKWPASAGDSELAGDRPAIVFLDLMAQRLAPVLEAHGGALDAATLQAVIDDSLREVLKRDLALGQVVAGEMRIVGEPFVRARVRGQVVAVGPQKIAGRRFDAAVVELFGDVQSGDSSTRLDGAIVIDRHSGVLLRLDLRSAQPRFQLQRRLVRVDAAP